MYTVKNTSQEENKNADVCEGQNNKLRRRIKMSHYYYSEWRLMAHKDTKERQKCDERKKIGGKR